VAERLGYHGCMRQCVRQRDVDRVTIRVVHQGLEVAVDALHAEALGERVSLGERAAQAGSEPRARVLDHGRGDEIARHPAETHETPADWGWCVRHEYSSLWTRGVRGPTPQIALEAARRNMDGQQRLDAHDPRRFPVAVGQSYTILPQDTMSAGQHPLQGRRGPGTCRSHAPVVRTVV